MSSSQQHMANSPKSGGWSSLAPAKVTESFQDYLVMGFCFTFQQYIMIEKEMHKSVNNLLLVESTFSLGLEISMAQ